MCVFDLERKLPRPNLCFKKDYWSITVFLPACHIYREFSLEIVMIWIICSCLSFLSFIIWYCFQSNCILIDCYIYYLYCTIADVIILCFYQFWLNILTPFLTMRR
jgi:hypothetical protein